MINRLQNTQLEYGTVIKTTPFSDIKLPHHREKPSGTTGKDVDKRFEQIEERLQELQDISLRIQNKQDELLQDQKQQQFAQQMEGQFAEQKQYNEQNHRELYSVLEVLNNDIRSLKENMSSVQGSLEQMEGQWDQWESFIKSQELVLQDQLRQVEPYLSGPATSCPVSDEMPSAGVAPAFDTEPEEQEQELTGSALISEQEASESDAEDKSRMESLLQIEEEIRKELEYLEQPQHPDTPISSAFLSLSSPLAATEVFEESGKSEELEEPSAFMSFGSESDINKYDGWSYSSGESSVLGLDTSQLSLPEAGESSKDFAELSKEAESPETESSENGGATDIFGEEFPEGEFSEFVLEDAGNDESGGSSEVLPVNISDTSDVSDIVSDVAADTAVEIQDDKGLIDLDESPQDVETSMLQMLEGLERSIDSEVMDIISGEYLTEIHGGMSNAVSDILTDWYNDIGLGEDASATRANKGAKGANEVRSDSAAFDQEDQEKIVNDGENTSASSVWQFVTSSELDPEPESEEMGTDEAGRAEEILALSQLSVPDDGEKSDFDYPVQSSDERELHLIDLDYPNDGGVEGRSLTEVQFRDWGSSRIEEPGNEGMVEEPEEEEISFGSQQFGEVTENLEDTNNWNDEPAEAEDSVSEASLSSRLSEDARDGEEEASEFPPQGTLEEMETGLEEEYSENEPKQGRVSSVPERRVCFDLLEELEAEEALSQPASCRVTEEMGLIFGEASESVRISLGLGGESSAGSDAENTEGGVDDFPGSDSVGAEVVPPIDDEDNDVLSARGFPDAEVSDDGAEPDVLTEADVEVETEADQPVSQSGDSTLPDSGSIEVLESAENESDESACEQDFSTSASASDPLSFPDTSQLVEAEPDVHSIGSIAPAGEDILERIREENEKAAYLDDQDAITREIIEVLAEGPKPEEFPGGKAAGHGKDKLEKASTLLDNRQNLTDQALAMLESQPIDNPTEALDERLSSEISHLLTELSYLEELELAASQRQELQEGHLLRPEEEDRDPPGLQNRLELPDNPFELPGVDTAMYMTGGRRPASRISGGRGTETKSADPEQAPETPDEVRQIVADVTEPLEFPESSESLSSLSSVVDFGAKEAMPQEGDSGDPLHYMHDRFSDSGSSAIMEIPENPMALPALPEAAPKPGSEAPFFAAESGGHEQEGLVDSGSDPDTDLSFDSSSDPEVLTDMDIVRLPTDLPQEVPEESGKPEGEQTKPEENVPEVDKIMADRGIPVLNINLSAIANDGSRDRKTDWSDFLLEDSEEFHILLDEEA
ncbi:hypothetical protein P0082_08180 [Candidatus Haliotispira prima]|uniref:Uncharacterized protein n=1 Tax=Candidatus Haliotispira prima TaxID=3034016 RepID=A0ABY8MF26_9SPIO|nr:hypothetical protein P0082_08180 [Candidatus Haliotispira prima]